MELTSDIEYNAVISVRERDPLKCIIIKNFFYKPLFANLYKIIKYTCFDYRNFNKCLKVNILSCVKSYKFIYFFA